MRPVIYGEVLFDIFPDTAVLGGAAFNVAWHLQGFGAKPLFISCVGTDTLGKKIKNAMKTWGMDLTGLQNDAFHPTGQVNISTNGNQHNFDIIADQAYDYINTEKALAAICQDASLLYHGSLIARNSMSKATLMALRERLHVPLFIDINIREPWWSMTDCLELMEGAAWIKLNNEELAKFQTSEKGLETDAQTLREKLGAETLIVTRGENGAVLFEVNQVHSCTPCETELLVDTVGAGDAFSAVMIFGLLKRWPIFDSLKRAQEFAQEVCRHRGAIVREHQLYQNFLELWAEDSKNSKGH